MEGVGVEFSKNGTYIFVRQCRRGNRFKEYRRVMDIEAVQSPYYSINTASPSFLGSLTAIVLLLVNSTALCTVPDTLICANILYHSHVQRTVPGYIPAR